MTTTDDGLLARVSVFLGRFRAMFVPFGLFAVLAIGIHSGSDHIDDVTYECLNAIDAVLDRVLAVLIRLVWRFFGARDATIDAAIFWAVDLIDLSVKDQIARIVALIIELLADVILALPVFLYREVPIPIRNMIAKTAKDPTILRVVSPVSAALASIAGVLITTREVQVFTNAQLLTIRAATSFAGWLASIGGMLALILVSWRLGWVVTVAAMRWAESRALEDERNQVPKRKRWMRGWFAALIAAPISCFAFIDAVAVIGRIRALIPG